MTAETAKKLSYLASKSFKKIMFIIQNNHLTLRNIYDLLLFFSPIYDAYCQSHYADGHCDYGCNNAECNWDGLDCEREPPRIAEGAMRLVLRMDYHQLISNITSFLRDVRIT